MKRTQPNLLQFANREPYEPVTELIDVPTAFLETIRLAERAEKGDASAATTIKGVNAVGIHSCSY